MEDERTPIGLTWQDRNTEWNLIYSIGPIRASPSEDARGFMDSEAISRATPTAGAFLHLIDDRLPPPRAPMDPAEERRETKRQKEYINMLGYVADSEYRIPTRCLCGGRIIDEVRGKEDYDTLRGKRFFTCKNYQADGFHYRQPWVIGVQEEIECL
ncbi:unnamed protein product, partial [Brassica napus]